MAMALGAATDLLDEAHLASDAPHGRRQPSAAVPEPAAVGVHPGAVATGHDHRRHVRTAVTPTSRCRTWSSGRSMFARDHEVGAIPSWLVFDDGFRRRSLFGVVPGQLPEQWISDGFIKRADTLAELAMQCGIDAEGLESTVKRFNEFAHAGVDADFHRGESAYDRFMGDPRQKPNNCLAPLDRATVLCRARSSRPTSERAAACSPTSAPASSLRPARPSPGCMPPATSPPP